MLSPGLLRQIQNETNYGYRKSYVNCNILYEVCLKRIWLFPSPNGKIVNYNRKSVR